MRNLIVLGAVLALGGCGQEQSAEERAAAEQNVTALVVATNDTTAIDAATGEDANMAADAAFMPTIENEADGNQAAPPAARIRPARTTRQSRALAPETATPDEDEPEANSL